MLSKQFEPEFEHQARTLDPSVVFEGYTLSNFEQNKVYTRTHDNGWTVTGEIHKDWYEWVNSFVAIHPVHGIVVGNFEYEISYESEEGYNNFIECFEVNEWDYWDI